MKKKSLIGIAVLAALCVAAAGAVYAWGGQYLASRLSAACESAYGSAPKFGETPEVSLFPLGATADEFSWDLSAPDYSARITAGGAKAVLEFSPLLSGDLRFKEILIDAPKIEAKLKKGDAEKAPASDAANGTAARVFIDRLAAQRGELSVETEGEVWRADNINIVATNIDLRRGADLKGDFTFAAPLAPEGKTLVGNLAFKGAFHYKFPNATLRQASFALSFPGDGPLGKFSPARLNLDGALNASDKTLRFTEASLETPPAKIKLNGEAPLDFQKFTGAAQVSLDLDRVGEDFDGPPLSGELILSSPVAYAYPLIDLPALALKMGETQGEGRLRLTLPSDGKPLAVSGSLACGVIRFAASPRTEKSSSANAVKTGDPQTDARPDIDFAVKAAGIAAGKLDIKNIAFKITGKNGDYAIPNLKFNWEGGAVNAAMTLKLPQWRWTFVGDGKNIDMGKMLSRFGVDGFEQGSGSFAAKLEAAGSDTRTIASSLSGSGQFTVSRLRASVLEDLAHTLTFFSRGKINPTGISVDAPFAAKNGAVVFENLTASSSAITARGEISLDFANDYLKSLIRFKIGGLTLPLSVRGPFDKISVGLD